MIQGISMYERKGLNEYRNKQWVWRAVICADELYNILANNKDELPDVEWSEIYHTLQNILRIKYALLELIGRDSK